MKRVTVTIEAHADEIFVSFNDFTLRHKRQDDGVAWTGAIRLAGEERSLSSLAADLNIEVDDVEECVSAALNIAFALSRIERAA